MWKFKIILLILFLVIFSSLNQSRISAQQRIQSQSVQDFELSSIDKSLERIETHLDFNDRRIVELQNDLYTWKGIVVGVGSIVAILDLLQALGFVRGRIKESRSS